MDDQYRAQRWHDTDHGRERGKPLRRSKFHPPGPGGRAGVHLGLLVLLRGLQPRLGASSAESVLEPGEGAGVPGQVNRRGTSTMSGLSDTTGTSSGAANSGSLNVQR